MAFFKKEKAKAGPVVQAVTEEAFTPDGQLLQDGGVRYKILCDGGIDPSGVFWTKIVPPGATIDDYKAAQAERDEKQRELKELSGGA